VSSTTQDVLLTERKSANPSITGFFLASLPMWLLNALGMLFVIQMPANITGQTRTDVQGEANLTMRVL